MGRGPLASLTKQHRWWQFTSKLFKNSGHGSSILPNIQGTVYSPCVPWSATDSCACDPPVVGTQWCDLHGADMAVASDWTRHWRSSGSSQSVSSAHWGACAMAAMGRAVANVYHHWYQGLDFRNVTWTYPVVNSFYPVMRNVRVWKIHPKTRLHYTISILPPWYPFGPPREVHSLETKCEINIIFYCRAPAYQRRTTMMLNLGDISYNITSILITSSIINIY